MRKFLLANAIVIAIACSTFPQSVEGKLFNCARAKTKRKCRRGRFALRGCFWCGDTCGHYSECESAQPTCEKLRARRRKQKMICKAQGCEVIKRKCVTPKELTQSPSREFTDSPTTAPISKPANGCNTAVRVIRGQVDVVGRCTVDCPCKEFDTGCESDSECEGDLKCAQASAGEFGLKEAVSVCLSKESIEEPLEPDVEEEAREDVDDKDGDIDANIPSLEQVRADPALIASLPDEILQGLDGTMLELARQNPGDLLAKIDEEIVVKYNPTRPPITRDVDDVDAGFTSRCSHAKKLGQIGFCSLSCKCGEGEGFCRKNEECMKGLKCQKRRGKYYGLSSRVAVCVRDENQPGVWEASGKFEGDIDVETSTLGIKQVVERYGAEAAKQVVNKFPASARDGAPVFPSLTLPPIDEKETVFVPAPDKVDLTSPPTDGPLVLVTPPPTQTTIVEPTLVEPTLVEPTLSIRGGGRQLKNKRQLGATEKNILWPSGIIYYRYHSSVTASVKNVIEDAMNHWKSKTCIKFVLRSNQGNYVEFKQPSSGCSSAVGMQGGKQTINLAQGCGFGAAVHEIMHAAGFWHEQSRPDRDSFVKINWDNIRDGKSHNFNRKGGSEVDSMGSVYDYGSIMHYGATAFSKNGKATIEPKVDGVTIGQRSGLSDHDQWQIKKLYNCLSTCPAGHYTKTFLSGAAPFCLGTTCPSHAEEIGRARSNCWLGDKAQCKSCCKKVTTTVYKWFGTAPFCNGQCPSGWTYVRRSKSGNGATCWIGWKRLCKKVTKVEQCKKPKKDYNPSCPPGGKKHAWFGAAPFCSPSSCPSGWTQVKTSNRGDGALCWFGTKKLCKRSC